MNKPDDQFCGGCGAMLPGAEPVAAKPAAGKPPSVPIPSIPRKGPPPLAAKPAHKSTVAIETVSDLVISESYIEMPIG